MSKIDISSKLEEAYAIMTLISMTDEVASDVKDETALAAMVARRIIQEVMGEVEAKSS